MAVPLFRAVQETGRSDGVSLTAASPAATEAGDLLVAVLYAYDRTVTPSASGWTLIRRTVHPSSNFQLCTFWRWASAGGGHSAAFTWGGASFYRQATIAAVAGTHPTRPIDAESAQTNGASTSITAPSITTTVADTLLLMGIGLHDLATLAPPAGMVDRLNIDGHALFTEARASAGATGTRVATAGASMSSVGALVAVAPAPAEPVPGTYSNGTAGSATSASVSAPSGRRVGDLLTAHLYLDAAGATITTTAGWTLINQTAQSSFQVASWARIATGDSADAFRASWSGSYYAHAGMMNFSGVDGSRPIDAAGADGSGNSRAPSARGLTTTGPDRLLVWCQGGDAPATVTVPSGFVQHDRNSGLLVATAVQAAAGASGDRTGAMSVSQLWATHMFAIAPRLDGGATIELYDGSAWTARQLHGHDGSAWTRAAGIGAL